MVKYDAAGAPVGVSLYGAAHSFGVHKPTLEAVAVTYDVSACSIAVLDNAEPSVSEPLVIDERDWASALKRARGCHARHSVR